MDMRDESTLLRKLQSLLRMIGIVCSIHELLIGLLLVVVLGIMMISTLSFDVICFGSRGSSEGQEEVEVGE
jgi:hypothetical protein